MAAKKRGLGTGLDALIPQKVSTPVAKKETVVKTETVIVKEPSGEPIQVNINKIEPNREQPRKKFEEDSLQELAESIRQFGIITPLLVQKKDDYYEIIAGERRWRASKMAGLTEIPAIIMEADDLKTAQIALIENIQRENLNPVEEAEAYRTLMNSFDLTQEEVASKVGKSRSAVANSMRLLDLPESAAKYLREGVLSAGHCRALLGLKQRELIAPLADRVVLKNLSVRETEKAVKDANKTKKETVPPLPDLTVNYVTELERKVTGECGRYVKINSRGKRKTVTVEYSDDDDLETLLSAICGKDVTEE